MSQIYIRRGRETDAGMVRDLVPNLKPLTQHTPYTYWNMFKNFGDSCFVAIDSRQPVGFVTSHPTTTPRKEWFVWQVGVLEHYRGRGIAGDLLQRVVGVAQDAGAAALTTTIEVSNPRSLGAFVKLARTLGTTIKEVDRFNLDPNSSTSVPEVIYRIPIE